MTFILGETLFFLPNIFLDLAVSFDIKAFSSLWKAAFLGGKFSVEYVIEHTIESILNCFSDAGFDINCNATENSETSPDKSENEDEDSFSVLAIEL